MPTYTPITELDAVNALMEILGEAPVSSLDDLALDAGAAQNTLARVNREVLAAGWHFNRGYYQLIRDANLEFPLPTNVLAVDTVGYDADIDVVLRAGKVHNKSPYQNTTKFYDQTTLTVEIVEFLDFDDLPATAKQFIYLKAAVAFVRSQLGPRNIDQTLLNELQEARVAMESEEIMNTDANYLASQADVLARRLIHRNNSGSIPQSSLGTYSSTTVASVADTTDDSGTLS